MKKPVKKREKKYRPMDALARSLQSKHGKWLAANDAPMNSRLNEGRLAARFAPILCVFKEMEETGESMVNQKNEVVYLPEQLGGVYYPLAPSMLMSCKTFDIACRSQGVPLVSSGMRRAAAKLNAGMVLCQSDIDEVRRSIADVIEVMGPMTPMQIEACVQAEEIQELLEKAA